MNPYYTDGKFDEKKYQEWYRNNNRDSLNEWHRKNYKNNRERINQKKKEYYLLNKEEIIIRNKQYYQLNRKDAIKQKGEYVKKHRGRYNKQERERYASSPQKRIETSMRTSMGRSINDKKRRSWEDLVGYSLQQLMKHLESQFQEGMTWDNYGEWHIDHIVPRSIFNYDSCEDNAFKCCWSLDNLQPLWASENMSKGGGERWLSKQ